MYRFIVTMIVIMAAVSGCMNQQGENGQSKKNTGVQQSGFETEPIEQANAHQAASYAESREEITDAIAVNTEDTLVIAVKVKPFNRFRLPEIQRELRSDFKKMFPETKIELTTDKKIFMKLEELEEQLQNNDISMKKFRKKVKEITDLSKEK